MNNNEQKQETNTGFSENAIKHGLVKNTTMAFISYIGPLVVVSYAIAKDDPFVKFHIKQGSVLFTIEIVLWILGEMLPMLIPLVSLAQLAALVLSVIGIINALREKEKELPFVGKYASHFKI